METEEQLILLHPGLPFEHDERARVGPLGCLSASLQAGLAGWHVAPAVRRGRRVNLGLHCSYCCATPLRRRRGDLARVNLAQATQARLDLRQATWHWLTLTRAGLARAAVACRRGESDNG